mgnify:CR=1 FL=1
MEVEAEMPLMPGIQPPDICLITSNMPITGGWPHPWLARGLIVKPMG